jgi:hypothetical protein
MTQQAPRNGTVTGREGHLQRNGPIANLTLKDN